MDENEAFRKELRDLKEALTSTSEGTDVHDVYRTIIDHMLLGFAAVDLKYMWSKSSDEDRERLVTNYRLACDMFTADVALFKTRSNFEIALDKLAEGGKLYLTADRRVDLLADYDHFAKEVKESQELEDWDDESSAAIQKNWGRNNLPIYVFRSSPRLWVPKGELHTYVKYYAENILPHTRVVCESLPALVNCCRDDENFFGADREYINALSPINKDEDMNPLEDTEFDKFLLELKGNKSD